MEWFIAEWPDGDWCNWSEREIAAMLEYKSDDFIRARVLTWDEAYTPVLTAPAPLVVYVNVLGVARFSL